MRPEDGIINRDTDFAIVEVYKSIRTSILYSLPKTETGKVILLTSSNASEGKTTTCTNLAITMAQVNARVLLIDCDLRKPKVHRYLKLDNKEGLSNVLCGFSDLNKAIKRNVRERFDVLTAGGMPPNPAELLQTEAFDRVINYLKTKYDYIIIDTPPINVVTDAAIVVKNTSGVILLVKKAYTTYDMVEEAVEKLKGANAKILGSVVIDDKDNSKSSPYYKKSKYGGYGYRDDVARGAKK